MGRETLRQRERRAAHFRVRHEGLADRAPVDAATVQRCLRGLDKHNCNHFGVRACVRMELDGLHEPPSHAWCGGTRCLLPWPAVGKRTTFIAAAFPCLRATRWGSRPCVAAAGKNPGSSWHISGPL